MTTALQAILGDALVTELGPAAKTQGFRRARRVWRRSNQRGDWAAFDVQSSQWDTAESIECVVNVGAAPQPWLDFRSETHGVATRNFGPADGLFRSRLGSRPEEGDDSWWSVESEAEARSVAREIADRMTAEGFRLIDELLDRDQMTKRIQDGRMGLFSDFNPYWLAVVLADDGPSRELDEALQRASADFDPEDLKELVAWCRTRSAKAEHKNTHSTTPTDTH
jgi:hypothetical protein